MSKMLDRYSPIEVGERLRIAREAARMTIRVAAATANMARTTLVAIEQGQRKIRMDELICLAKWYDTSVNALLRQEAIYIDLTSKFRKLARPADSSIEAAAQLLSDLARAEAELEGLLGSAVFETIRNNIRSFRAMSISRRNRMLSRFDSGSVSALGRLPMSRLCLNCNSACACSCRIWSREYRVFMRSTARPAHACCSMPDIRAPPQLYRRARIGSFGVDP